MSSKIHPYIIFDFETGGLDGNIHAATEIAMLCIDGESLQEVGRYESYIKPYVYEYTDGAMEFTGLTLEFLQAKGKDLKVVVKEIEEWVTEMKALTAGTSYRKKPVVVGHNVLFDICFLEQIFKEAKLDITKSFAHSKGWGGKIELQYIDTITMARLTWGNDSMMEKFNLGACVEKAGLEIADAHKAINDVIATKELLVYSVNRLRNDSGVETNTEKIRVRDELHFQF